MTHSSAEITGSRLTNLGSKIDDDDDTALPNISAASNQHQVKVKPVAREDASEAKSDTKSIPILMHRREDISHQREPKCAGAMGESDGDGNASQTDEKS